MKEIGANVAVFDIMGRGSIRELRRWSLVGMQT